MNNQSLEQQLLSNHGLIVEKALDALNTYYSDQYIDPNTVDPADKTEALCALLGAYITLNVSDQHPIASHQYMAQAEAEIQTIKNGLRIELLNYVKEAK